MARPRAAATTSRVGIELEGTDDAPSSAAQYAALAALIARCADALPLRDIAAHSDIAPGRKTDPGAHFDWARLLAGLARAQVP